MKDNIVKLTHVQKIIKFLKEHREEKFTAREIAEWIFENYPEESIIKGENSKNKLITDVSGLEKDKAIINAIQAEIGAHLGRGLEKENHFIKITEGKPRKYYYTEKTDLEEIQIIEKEIIESKSKTKESDLYNKLSEFLYNERKIYSKRINEKRSKNSSGGGGNYWLHPDQGNCMKFNSIQ